MPANMSFGGMQPPVLDPQTFDQTIFVQLSRVTGRAAVNMLHVACLYSQVCCKQLIIDYYRSMTLFMVLSSVGE